MALSETGKRSELSSERVRRWRDALLPLALAGMVGILIGGYTIAVAYLDEKWAMLSLVAVAGFFMLLAIGKLRPVLLAALLIDIPFQIDIYLGFNEALDKVTFVNGYNVSITTGILVVLYLIWIAEIITSYERLSIPIARVSLPLLIYIGFAALSMLVAPNIKYSLMELFLLVQMALVFVYIVGTVRTEDVIRLITLYLLVGLILESLVMIGIRLRGESLVLPIMLIRVADNLRVGGTVGSPNEAGAYLAMALSVTLGVFFADTKRWLKLLAIPAFGLGLVAIVLTGSRGGWLGFGVAMVATYVLLWRRVNRSTLALLIVPAVLFATLFLFKDTLLQRLLGTDNGSAAARWPLIQLAFLMAIRNPVLGVGLNNFVFVAPDYLTFQISQEWFSTVHNKYMLIWSEIGTGGLIAYLWFLIATLYRGWQISKADHPALSPLAAGYTAAIIAAMVHMTVELYHGRAQVEMLWLAAAVVSAISFMRLPDTSQQPSRRAYAAAPTPPVGAPRMNR
jgi:putative inorganic carbon (HCO3(-)) transporter